MAKQPLEQENPFRKTSAEQTADNADLDEGRIMSAGVGIRAGEMAALDALAERHEVSRNSLMHWAVRLFIEGVRAGKIDIESLYEEPDKPKKQSKIGRQGKR